MSILDGISELEQSIEALFAEARQNEYTLRKFQAFEIALMNAESPLDFFDLLLNKARQTLDWDEITLVLVDKNYGIRRLLSHSGDLLEENSNIMFIENAGELSKVYRDGLQPTLTVFDPEVHDHIFPGDIDAPASIALIPLIHQKQLSGSFNIGSQDEDRFSGEVATDFLAHLARIIAVCLENILAKEHLKYLGLIDNLTGVNNRRFFDQRLLEETARALRTSQPVSCLFIDIDHFKKINDNYGHLTGDLVLRHVAQLIREQLRNIDIVARYGGEEFTVILQQADNARALEVAERIRLHVFKHPFLTDDGQHINTTTSIGLNTLVPAQLEGDVEPIARNFVEGADQALYNAKNSGRNRAVCYTTENSG